MWCNCHLHSSSHQRMLTNDKVTEAVIDDPGGSFFSDDGAQMLLLREQDVSDECLRYKVVAQTQFTSLGTTGSSEEPSTRQRLQRRGTRESEAELIIKKKLHFLHKWKTLQTQRRFSMFIYFFT